MWDVTEWAAITWLKTTAVLAAVLGVCWLAFGAGSGQFTIAVVVAALAELHVTRQLAREWRDEAGLRWWWSA